MELHLEIIEQEYQVEILIVNIEILIKLYSHKYILLKNLSLITKICINKIY